VKNEWVVPVVAERADGRVVTDATARSVLTAEQHVVAVAAEQAS
jgi:hypothetical protein